MIQEEPYFMSDDKWCYFDAKKRKWMLTEDAPPKAVKSYEEYYKNMKRVMQNE